MVCEKYWQPCQQIGQSCVKPDVRQHHKYPLWGHALCNTSFKLI